MTISYFDIVHVKAVEERVAVIEITDSPDLR